MGDARRAAASARSASRPVWEPRSWIELRNSAGVIDDAIVGEAAPGQGVGGRLMEKPVLWLEEHRAAT
jgi:hypothetical protein